MSDIDLAHAKAEAKANYQAKFANNRHWKSTWGTFDNLLEHSHYKTS